MDQTSEERERLARDLAIEEGRRRERVDARLENHKDRLDAINGSIARHAKAVEDLKTEMAQLAEEQRIRNELERDRARQLAEASKRQITNRTFVLGVLPVLIALLAIFIQLRGGH